MMCFLNVCEKNIKESLEMIIKKSQRIIGGGALCGMLLTAGVGAHAAFSQEAIFAVKCGAALMMRQNVLPLRIVREILLGALNKTHPFANGTPNIEKH